MPSEILRVSIFLSYLGKFYVARNLLFSKVTKKFSWTYTLEFWAENFSQYSPLKVEEHNVPSEFRSDAWFMRKKIVSILKKTHCTSQIFGFGQVFTFTICMNKKKVFKKAKNVHEKNFFREKKEFIFIDLSIFIELFFIENSIKNFFDKIDKCIYR